MSILLEHLQLMNILLEHLQLVSIHDAHTWSLMLTCYSCCSLVIPSSHSWFTMLNCDPWCSLVILDAHLWFDQVSTPQHHHKIMVDLNTQNRILINIYMLIRVLQCKSTYYVWEYGKWVHWLQVYLIVLEDVRFNDLLLEIIIVYYEIHMMYFMHRTYKVALLVDALN